jgi:putative aminopeptidase FrvX
MNQINKDILRLSNLIGISSREQDIAKDVRSHFESLGYEIYTDPIGNVVVSRNNRSNKTHQKIMFFAHMDEIGFIVRKIEANGFIRFERVGGVNTQILPGTKIIILGDKKSRKGVIGVKSHHFMPANEKFIVPQINEMYIDAFVKSKKELYDLGIDVGTFIALDSETTIIDDEYVVGKSLDNRVCMAVLYELAKTVDFSLLNYDLYFCFPVMEEFNIRGILPIIRRIKPDITIGLDITPSNDTPDLDYNDIALGKGPALTSMNFHSGGTLAGVLPDKELYDLIKLAAKTKEIHLQNEVAPGVITENAFILFENEGVKVANLSIPTRYTHTSNETMMLSDINALLNLLTHLVNVELVRFIKQRKEKL